MSGTLYSEGVVIDETEFPQTAGVILGNAVAWSYNINLIETEGADPQNVYFKHCTLVKHQIRDSNRMWRHNTGGGEGVFALLEDCMILNVDLSVNDQIRIDTDDPDFFGSMFNTKFWNYGSETSNVNGITINNWNIDAGKPILLEDAGVDISTPGGLDIGDVSALFRIDGRTLTTFQSNAVELTLASDGGPVGYRLPETAPSSGALPIIDGLLQSGIHQWMLH